MAGEMSFSVSRSVNGVGKTIGGTTQTVMADAGTRLQKVIPASTTNGEMDVAIDVSAVKVIALVASKDSTIKTNNTSTPTDTLTMKANVPKIWVTGDDEALYLTGDVTKFYVTTGTSDTTVDVVVGYDCTPVLGE